MSERKKFWFSQIQKTLFQKALERVDGIYNLSPMFALLDDGTVKEYSECTEIELPPQLAAMLNNSTIQKSRIQPHSERYSDSVYLGEGVTVYVNATIEELEKLF